MPKPRIELLTGEAAKKAASESARVIAEEKAELDRRGAKTYEAVVLHEDGSVTSAVQGDEGQD